jgi:formamidopyrimidine-DNA glycosylase
MPEICEVILTSQMLKEKLLNKKLLAVKIIKGRYLTQSFVGFDKLVYPLEVINIDTHGKFMWFQFKSGQTITYLLNTFGLSGMWNYKKTPETLIEFDFGADKVYWEDTRNFGTFQYDVSNTSFNLKINKLAPDFLKTKWDNLTFLEWCKTFINANSKRKNLPIVKVLMGQNKTDGIGSGLGNYLVPEILYRCKLSPHKTLSSFNDEQIMLLGETIRQVIKLCYVYNETGYMTNMVKWVKKHQEGLNSGKYPNYHPDIVIGPGQKFVFKVYRRKLDPFGNKIIGEKIISGRTTYWSPKIQVN